MHIPAMLLQGCLQRAVCMRSSFFVEGLVGHVECLGLDFIFLCAGVGTGCSPSKCKPGCAPSIGCPGCHPAVLACSCPGGPFFPALFSGIPSLPHYRPLLCPVCSTSNATRSCCSRTCTLSCPSTTVWFVCAIQRARSGVRHSRGRATLAENVLCGLRSPSPKVSEIRAMDGPALPSPPEENGAMWHPPPPKQRPCPSPGPGGRSRLRV